MTISHVLKNDFVTHTCVCVLIEPNECIFFKILVSFNIKRGACLTSNKTTNFKL